MGGRGGPGPALRDDTAVRERLPALVQAGREGARGRTGPQALSSSSDALRAALGGPAHAGGGAQPRRSAARELGSGWLAGRNEGGAASARRHRRSPHPDRRATGGLCAVRTPVKKVGVYKGGKPRIDREAVHSLPRDGEGPTEIAKALGISW